MRLELWLIEDDRLCRRSVARLLRSAAPGFEIFTFGTVGEADFALAERTPAGLLVDERLGDDRGHTWIIARRSALRDAHVVLFTGFVTPAVSECAYRAADGLLIKPVTLAGLQQFVERASAPRPITIDVALAESRERWRLTPTESHVLELVAKGVSRGMIAHRLDVAPNTVKHHINAIMRKSGRHTLPEVVASIFKQLPLTGRLPPGSDN